MPTISDLIRKFRTDIGLTQEGLARAVDCTLSAMTKYELGRAPQPKQLLALLRLAELHEHPAAAVFRVHLRRDLGAPVNQEIRI